MDCVDSNFRSARRAKTYRVRQVLNLLDESLTRPYHDDSNPARPTASGAFEDEVFTSSTAMLANARISQDLNQSTQPVEFVSAHVAAPVNETLWLCTPKSRDSFSIGSTSIVADAVELSSNKRRKRS